MRVFEGLALAMATALLPYVIAIPPVWECSLVLSVNPLSPSPTLPSLRLKQRLKRSLGSALRL